MRGQTRGGGLLLLCWYVLNSVTREKENCGALKHLFPLEIVSLADSVICVVNVFIFQRHKSKISENRQGICEERLFKISNYYQISLSHVSNQVFPCPDPSNKSGQKELGQNIVMANVYNI